MLLLPLVFGITVSPTAPAEPDVRWRAGGHFISVQSVEFLPDGQRLISASANVDVKLWHVPTRRLDWTSSDGRFGMGGVSFSRDGNFYVASDRELGTNLVVRRLSGDFPTTPLGSLRVAPTRTAISPSGQRVAAFGLVSTPVLDRDLRVWDVATGREIAAWPSDQPPGVQLVERLEFLTEDDLLIGSLDSVTRWSVDGRVRWSRPAPSPGDISLKAVSPDRSRILIEENRVLRLLDSATGLALWELAAPNFTSWSACFDRDGARFVLAYSDSPTGEGRLEIRATVDATLQRTLSSPFMGPIPAFSPDGNTLACGHFHGIDVLSLSGDAMWESLTESSGPYRCLAVSSAGNWMAAGADGGRLAIRRLDSGVTFRSIDTGNTLSALVASPDGEWLAFTTNGSRLVRYHPSRGVFEEAGLETGPVFDLSIAANGSRLLALPGSGDAWMVDPATWLPTARPVVPAGKYASTSAWARDGSRVTIAFTSGRSLTYAKDTSEAQFTRDWSEDRLVFFEYLPGGEAILSFHRSGNLRRWRVSDGEIVSELATGRPDMELATLSPDQRLLFTSRRGDGIRILDTVTGSEVDHWTLEMGYQTRRLRVSADGSWLVNARLDGALVGAPAPFILQDVRAAPSALEFSVGGGSDGPYQLQRRPAGAGSWIDVEPSFRGRTVSTPYDDPVASFYRLVRAP